MAPQVPAQPVAPPAPLPPHAPVESARVHLASNYAGTWLELKSSVDDGRWARACPAPCDRVLVVHGMLARAVAPGMTPSNAFRIDPGPGTASIKVEGGSSRSRTLGIVGLGAGIPTSLAGMTMFSYGKASDADGLATAGAIVLGAGALVVLVALPLLFSGRTGVKNGNGDQIASLLRSPHL